MNKEEGVPDNEDHPGAIIRSLRASDEHTLLTITTPTTLPISNPVFLEPHTNLDLGLMTFTVKTLNLTNKMQTHGILSQALEGLLHILRIILVHTPSPLTLTATSLAPPLRCRLTHNQDYTIEFQTASRLGSLTKTTLQPLLTDLHLLFLHILNTPLEHQGDHLLNRWPLDSQPPVQSIPQEERQHLVIK